jgi:hypothetical protein
MADRQRGRHALRQAHRHRGTDRYIDKIDSLLNAISNMIFKVSGSFDVGITILIVISKTNIAYFCQMPLIMDKRKLKGLNLGQVFNCRCGRASA